MALTAGTNLDSYEILGLLGAGGMGEVYRARDSVLKREVAIKVLPSFVSQDPDRLRRFEHEAQATAALNHPNILAVYQFGAYEGAPYLVSELLEGVTLRQYLQRGPTPVRKAIDYSIQIARGLAAAHEKGIVHRDLKPENIFVTKNGRVKILDFGLARLTQALVTSADAATVTLQDQTDPGAVLGTVGYMSPEQVRGATADHRADIFAFGAILYEMLARKRAFRKATSAETMTAILHEDPPAIAEIVPSTPLALARVVHRCLEKNPEQRFQSASDLAFALEALSDPGTFPPRTVSRDGLRKGVWTGAGALAIVLTVILLAWLRSSPVKPQVEGIKQLSDDGEGKDEFARIETDGVRVYFTEKYAGSFRLAQVSATGGQVAPVTTQIPAAYRASMAPDLSGLLVSENVVGHHPVWFQPLPAGDPRRLGSLEAQEAVFSPEGKHIFYTDGSTLYIADQDGANEHKLADLPGGAYWPAVSPDGKKIRVTVHRENGNTLWEVASDGSNMHRLANPGDDFSKTGYGRWTPDGHYFVFQGSREGRTDIWAIAERPRYLRGSISAPTLLTNGPLSCSLPTPSRDGKQIFARCAKLRGELVRYDRKSNQFVSFLGGISATDVMYSRDGGWVVYLSYPDRSLWRMRADGRDRLRLTYPPMTVWAPHISLDGTKVAFAGAGPASKRSIYIVSIAGGPLQKIVGEAADVFNSYWSPDGNALAFDSTNPLEQNSWEIRVVDLASGNVSVIPGSRGKSSPVWASPAALVAGAMDGSKLLRYDFETQTWSDLAAGPFSDWNSTDGNYVYCATMEPSPPAAVRIRVSDGQLEALADLAGLRRIVTYGSKELSLTPDGELLFTRDIGTQEIYALNIRWP